MTTLLITKLNPYLAVHEGFRLGVLHDLAEQYGFKVFVHVARNQSFDHKQYPKFHFTPLGLSEEQVLTELASVLQRIKPNKIVNLVEQFFPFDRVKTDAEKIYFVRNCAQKMLSVLGTTSMYPELATREQSCIASSNRVITDSANSKQVIWDYYEIDAPTCWETINPDKYHTLESPRNLNKSVYNVGRIDFQKGLYNVQPPTSWEFLQIGESEVDFNQKSKWQAPGSVCLGQMPFEHYKDLIAHCNFGLFPALWESNGYAVQECMAMGKVPVVQKGSAGNEQWCTTDNSFSVDFKGFNWEEFLDNVTDFRNMQEAARSTITTRMYNDGIKRFVDLVC